VIVAYDLYAACDVLYFLGSI